MARAGHHGGGHDARYGCGTRRASLSDSGIGPITGNIFADNYFELYVNGRFVARDPVPMTPFNSNVVRFRATFNIGDGGFIAYFSHGNGTHGDWRAETFYIAPLDDAACVRVAAGRDSTFCHQATRPVCADKDPRTCQALHFPVPADWAAPRFDDSRWPRAVLARQTVKGPRRSGD